jgi:hypothetical protein
LISVAKTSLLAGGQSGQPHPQRLILDLAGEVPIDIWAADEPG